MTAFTSVGVVGTSARATVGLTGGVEPAGRGFVVDWWVGADDRWRDPAREPAVRQTRVEEMPVTETAMRVPGGDAVQRVYAVGGGRPFVVVELENRSPAPFVAGFVLRPRAGGRLRAVALTRGVLLVDDRPALVVPRAPSLWVVTADEDPRSVAQRGDARDGPFPSTRSRHGLAVALLYPVAHRATLRVAVPGGPEVPNPEELARAPAALDVAHGWIAHLARGLQVEVPDPVLMRAVVRARAAVVLAAEAGPDPAVVAALEDWGFDDEAVTAWAGLGWRARRRAAQRPGAPPSWSDVAARLADGAPAPLLLALRHLLVHDGAAGVITLLADPPSGWQGLAIEVLGAPTRHGTVSYALRWHGARPALLWEVAGAGADLVLRAPGLDPGWSTRDSSGEALLGSSTVGVS